VSLFTDIMGQPGGELLFDTNGEAAIYVPRDEDDDEVPLTVLLGDIRTVERTRGNNKIKVQERDVTIWKAHSVYGGVAAPSLTASLSIAGLLWSITAIPADSANFSRVTVERTTQRYKTREQTFSNG